MIKRVSGLGIAALMMLMHSGCSEVGPDFPGVNKPNMPSNWEKKKGHSDADIAQWWKIFHDPVLNKLIIKTYAQNLDLKAAGLRIVQARAALGISEGLYFPQVQTLSGDLSSSRTGHGSSRYDVAAASVNFDMAWEMDVWGKYARGIESSEADLYASVASYRDIMVSVISEVARNYISYRTAEERMGYASRNITIQARVTEMTKIQFNAGNVSELDMQQSRSQLYATRATLPAFELSKVNARNAIAVLMGVNPEQVNKLLKFNSDREDTVNKYLSSTKGTMQIKDGDKDSLNIKLIPTARFNPYNKIDAELLTRRPDIKVAEYTAQSDNAKIGSAAAELYPSFTLFGNIGINSNNASGSWLSAGDAVGVTVGPSFSWNIFQYGRIKNNIRLQDAIFEESLVNYNNKVISAMSEVSNSLYGYRLTKEQQKENMQAVNASVRAFNISMIQYNDGLVSYQRLLSTVEKLTAQQDQYAQIKGKLATNIIALYKSLGGGWQMSRGKAYLSVETAEKMKKSVDWDTYLDPEMTRLPEGME